MSLRSFRAALALGGMLVVAGPALAQDAPPKISSTNAQLLATFEAPGQDDPYWVLTLEHFSTWQHGSNFFFVDLTDDPELDIYDEAPGLYLEFAPVLSLGSFGLPVSGGPLRDVGITAQVNAGWVGGEEGGFPIDRVWLEGVELAWSAPGFAVFNTQLLARQESGFDPSWQLTWVYTLPFQLGPANGVVTGFMDVWQRRQELEGAEGEDYTVLLAQPQVLFTLGSPEAGESFLQVGLEVEPSYNFPARLPVLDIEGWNVAFSPMVRWMF